MLNQVKKRSEEPSFQATFQASKKTPGGLFSLAFATVIFAALKRASIRRCTALKQGARQLSCFKVSFLSICACVLR